MTVAQEMLAAVREAFNVAPAWNTPPPDEGPPTSLVVTFRLPDDPAHPDARTRYYQPAGETLALLARRAGYVHAAGVEMVIEETSDPVGAPLVAVRIAP